MRIFNTLFFSIGILFSFSCYSWNNIAHMVVANIAYERLQPKTRLKVDKMVSDLATEYPNITQFTQIAPWPDALRAQRLNAFNHWHYIDYAFSTDGTPLKNLVDSDNIIWVINQIEPLIKNTNANPFEHGRFLAFLVHVVGDIHQPLHTVSRISVEYPDGDRGGNLYRVRYPSGSGQLVNLHKLWDEGFNLFTGSQSQSNVLAISHMITEQYPEEEFGSQVNDLNPENWASEGMKLSANFVYSTPENQRPNDEYVNKAKTIVEQRVALAGYRLANLLNSMLG